MRNRFLIRIVIVNILLFALLVALFLVDDRLESRAPLGSSNRRNENVCGCRLDEIFDRSPVLPDLVRIFVYRRLGGWMELTYYSENIRGRHYPWRDIVIRNGRVSDCFQMPRGEFYGLSCEE